MEIPVKKINNLQKKLLASTRVMEERINHLREDPSVLLKNHFLDPAGQSSL
jgi:hypothetical protein